MRQMDDCTQGFNKNLQWHFSIGQPQFCNEKFTEDFKGIFEISFFHERF